MHKWQEIGSEFYSVPLKECSSKLFPDTTQWFASGRSALKGILQELRWAKTVALPSWCCDSIIAPFVEAGKKVVFYPVLLSDGLTLQIETECDILLLIDYFGFDSQRVSNHKCIIRDITHSAFNAETNYADYYFGSMRKWCGIWSGGFAWANDGHSIFTDGSDDKGFFGLRKAAMEKKEKYINEGGDTEDKAEYLELFREAENTLTRIGAASGSKRDVEIVQYLDTDKIRNTRRNNARILLEQLRDITLFKELNDEDCPLFVPIITEAEKRDAVHRRLIENSIFCPKHWPVSKYHKLDRRMMELYNREISIVCDQRYSEEDMERIVKTLNTII